MKNYRSLSQSPLALSNEPLKPKSDLSNRVSRSRRRASDNTFDTATDLGSVGPGYQTLTLKGRGRVGGNDPVDVFKITVQPGTRVSAIDQIFRLKGGNVSVSGYVEVLGQRSLISSQKLKASESPFNINTSLNVTNSFQVPAYLYVELKQARGQVNYRYNIKFFE